MIRAALVLFALMLLSGCRHRTRYVPVYVPAPRPAGPIIVPVRPAPWPHQPHDPYRPHHPRREQ